MADQDAFASAAADARAAAQKAASAAADMTTKARLTRIKAILDDETFQGNLHLLALLGVGVGGNVEVVLDNNRQGFELLAKQVPQQLDALK